MKAFTSFFSPCFRCCTPSCIEVILLSFRQQFNELLTSLGDEHVSSTYTTILLNHTPFHQLLKESINKNIHHRLIHQYDTSYLRLIGIGIANLIVLKLLDYTSIQIESFCINYHPSIYEKNNTFVVCWLTKETQQKIAYIQPHPFIHLIEDTLIDLINHKKYNFDYYFGHIIKQCYETLNPLSEYQHLKSVVI